MKKWKTTTVVITCAASIAMILFGMQARAQTDNPMLHPHPWADYIVLGIIGISATGFWLTYQLGRHREWSNGALLCAGFVVAMALAYIIGSAVFAIYPA